MFEAAASRHAQAASLGGSPAAFQVCVELRFAFVVLFTGAVPGRERPAWGRGFLGAALLRGGSLFGPRGQRQISPPPPAARLPAASRHRRRPPSRPAAVAAASLFLSTTKLCVGVCVAGISSRLSSLSVCLFLSTLTRCSRGRRARLLLLLVCVCVNAWVCRRGVVV